MQDSSEYMFQFIEFGRTLPCKDIYTFKTFAHFSHYNYRPLSFYLHKPTQFYMFLKCNRIVFQMICKQKEKHGVHIFCFLNKNKIQQYTLEVNRVPPHLGITTDVL